MKQALEIDTPDELNGVTLSSKAGDTQDSVNSDSTGFVANPEINGVTQDTNSPVNMDTLKPTLSEQEHDASELNGVTPSEQRSDQSRLNIDHSNNCDDLDSTLPDLVSNVVPSTLGPEQMEVNTTEDAVEAILQLSKSTDVIPDE